MKRSKFAEVEIRPYRSDDSESVVAVFRSNIPKYFTPPEEPGLHEFLETTRDGDYYVVDMGGEVVGAGGIAYNDIEPPTVSLCWGMVRRDHLGTGLGKLLTDFRVGLAREKYPGLSLTISTSQHTEGFYKKYGFRTVEHTPDAFGPGIDNCRMRLDHSPADSEEDRR